MNMFSTKPKFDLAAFLAVPAPVGARRRGMRTKFGSIAKTAPKAESHAVKNTSAKTDE